MPVGPYELIGAGGLTLGMKQFYSKKLLSRVIPNLVHMQFAMKDGIPGNGGRSVEWRRVGPPGAPTTARPAGPPEPQPGELRLPVEFRHGKASVGGLPIGNAPRLG